MRHAKTSGVSDGADPTKVQPSDWNAPHVWVRPALTPVTFDATYGDDFTATSLDAKWALFGSMPANIAHVQSGARDGSQLWIPYDHGTATGGIKEAAPNANAIFSVCLALDWWQVGGGNIVWGIGIVDSSGNGMGVFAASNTGKVTINSMSGYGVGGSYADIIGGGLVQANFSEYIWMSIDRQSSGAWEGKASLSGRNYDYSQALGGGTSTITPAWYVLGVYATGANFSGRLRADWVQKV